MKISLTRYQIIEARSFGQARCGAKPQDVRFSDSGYHDDTDRAYPHMVGMAAEIAYSRVTGRPFDRTIKESGDGYDFPGGVEVKCSMFMGKDVELKVKVREYARKKPNKYVLCRVSKDLKTVEILGEITRGQFDKIKRKKNYGHQDNWVCGISDLTPVEMADTAEVRLAEADYAWMASDEPWGGGGPLYSKWKQELDGFNAKKRG